MNFQVSVNRGTIHFIEEHIKAFMQFYLERGGKPDDISDGDRFFSVWEAQQLFGWVVVNDKYISRRMGERVLWVPYVWAHPSTCLNEIDILQGLWSHYRAEGYKAMLRAVRVWRGKGCKCGQAWQVYYMGDDKP